MKSEIELHDKLSTMDNHKIKTPGKISDMVLAECLDLEKAEGAVHICSWRRTKWRFLIIFALTCIEFEFDWDRGIKIIPTNA